MNSLVLILVALANYWIWRIYQANALLAILEMVITLLLYNSFLKRPSNGMNLSPLQATGYPAKRDKFFRAFIPAVNCEVFSLKITRILIYTLLPITVILTLPSSFDRSIFTSFPDFEMQLNKRHNIYSAELKGLYANKWSIYYYKYLNFPFYHLQKNFFFNLDPNLYFFSGHPRETLSVQEFEKFFWWEIPLFFIGLYTLLRRGLKTVALYAVFASILAAFFSQSYQLGPLTLFPLIVLSVTVGLLQFSKLLISR